MKRSIASMLVFKTPFEDENIFIEKFKKAQEMFEDYIINSGIDLKKQIIEYNHSILQEYTHDELGIKISYSIKKEFSKNDYFPAIILDYSLNEYKFQKQDIESFLNDNIKFIFNVYFEDFFIDYDTKYKINDINKWKKVDYKQLQKIDMENPLSLWNKQILDSMMYLYYNLVKNIFEINKNSDTIQEILEFDMNIDYQANVDFFEKKQDLIKQDLLKTSQKLKMQIDIFIHLISRTITK